MKTATRIVVVIVGILFILSGLVKANDPIGLAYKMEEFFTHWRGDLQGAPSWFGKPLLWIVNGLDDATLPLSGAMITLEIVLGIALLIGWRKKAVLSSLLLLIIFFTFLTGYAYFSGNFKDCGCFGNCLPITPLASFFKDLALLALIIFLMATQRWIGRWKGEKRSGILLMLATILSLLLQWYVLNYLPIIDCLPFKKGASIPEGMKPPPGAPTDSTAIRYVYEKNGKRYEWDWSELPADYQTYTYVDRIDKLIRKGTPAPIHDFYFSGKGKDSMSGAIVDSTAIILALPEVVIGMGLDKNTGTSWTADFKEVISAATKKGTPVYFASNVRGWAEQLLREGGIDIPVFSTDQTALRTAARTNPCFYLLRKGVVMDKFSFRQLSQLKEHLIQP